MRTTACQHRVILHRQRPAGTVVFLVDRRNWAYDFVARSIARRLKPKWRCSVACSEERPYLDPNEIDILYVFFWGEKYYEQFGFSSQQIIKEVASYRWMTEERFGRLSPAEFVRRYLDGVATVTTPCAALCCLLRPLRTNVYHCPNGIEPSLFNAKGRERGDFTLVWAGNARDPGKGLYDVIVPAIGSEYRLIVADGRHSRLEMRTLYRSADLVLIASGMESQPLPLIEAMACGCFPVATNVGIVPEIVQDGFNGCVILNRTPRDLRRAVDWCAENLNLVREMGEWNAAYIRQYRTWDRLATRFDEILSHVLKQYRQGLRVTSPVAFCEHPIPSKVESTLCSHQSGSMLRNLGILLPLFVGDCWNSWRVVRFFSRAFGTIRRHAKSRDLCKLLLRDLHNVLGRAEHGD